MYTIVEWTMMYYSGLIAIFENKQIPKLIANPKNQWFSYQSDRTFYFHNHFLFIRKEATDKDYLLSRTPFVVMDLRDKKFGFIDFNISSIYYSPIHVEGTKYRFNLDNPREINNSTFENYNGTILDLSKIRFHDFNKIDIILEIYKEELENKN